MFQPFTQGEEAGQHPVKGYTVGPHSESLDGHDSIARSAKPLDWLRSWARAKGMHKAKTRKAEFEWGCMLPASKLVIREDVRSPPALNGQKEIKEMVQETPR